MMKKKLLLRAPVLTASGYGVHSRQVLRALLLSDKYDVSVDSIRWGETPLIYAENDLIERAKFLSAKYEKEKADGATFDVSVQVTIPNEFMKLAAVNIGITAGIETDHLSPDWLVKTNEVVDALIVPSKHSAEIFVNSKFNGSDGSVLELIKPIFVVNEGVEVAIFNTDSTEESVELFDIEPEFNFLYVGLGLDKSPGEDRKNLSSLIVWFCQKFKDNPNVGLVLKTSIVNGSLIDLEMTKQRILDLKKFSGAGKFPKIKLIHGRLNDEQLAALYKHPKIKAFVSLTHGEGFGLPLLEAAACGLPVLATDWSGHLDFLVGPQGQKLFVPISYSLGPVPESVVWKGVIEEGSRWAYPDENDAKDKMYKVYASYDKPKEWATKLSDIIKENFSLEKTGNDLAQLIDDIVSQMNPVTSGNTKEASLAAMKKKLLEESGGHPTLLYTMPMSAGDVYISTAVIDSLKKKFPEHKIFFATSQKYMDILVNNPDIHKVVDWQPWMQDIGVCEKVFDQVYTPNLAIQMVYSNWVHGGKGRLLAEEMANNCLVSLGDYKIEQEQYDGLPEKFILVHPGAGKDQWEARNYLHWQEVITNLSNVSGLPVFQLGMDGDPAYKDCRQVFNTTYRQMANVIAKATILVGMDTVSMHMAAGVGTPHIAIFGSSFSTSTGPAKSKSLSVLIDTPSRYTCEKACYKHQCSVNKEHPCINEIEPKNVVKQTLAALNLNFNEQDYKEYCPKISGYTHVFNPEEHDFPYLESIKSMMGFCDEVIVVDGGSTDGSIEKIKALGDKVQVIERQWDWEEPGMDGMQKAFGRALCTGDFLWQQDADEVVHEEDYDKIRKLTKRFPTDTTLLHLPVVELWGDEQTVRTDRHSWKWRLSKNDYRITHGIFKDARIYDDKTGKLFAKKGMSDGCEFVDIMTHDFIPHKGFYSRELEELRRKSPQEYGKKMNELFNELPSVYHYSWANLPRKIRSFKKFWNKCWSNLYNDENPVDRFPDVNTEDEIIKKASELKAQGGEHVKAQTFKLSRTNPAVMNSWLKK